MLRLPADRLEPPLSEPSQQVCPHWLLVVAHQGVREVLYTAKAEAEVAPEPDPPTPPSTPRTAAPGGPPFRADPPQRLADSAHPGERVGGRAVRRGGVT